VFTLGEAFTGVIRLGTLTNRSGMGTWVRGLRRAFLIFLGKAGTVAYKNRSFLLLPTIVSPAVSHFPCVPSAEKNGSVLSFVFFSCLSTPIEFVLLSAHPLSLAPRIDNCSIRGFLPIELAITRKHVHRGSKMETVPTTLKQPSNQIWCIFGARWQPSDT